MIKVLISAVIAYFLGNISPAMLISRSKGEDIRTKGSGNAGTTNVLRNYGKKAALLTLAIDMFKGILAVWIGRLIGGESAAFMSAVCVMVGHVWPVFYGFKGGKGVATSLGVLLAVNWKVALIVLVFALAIMAVSRMVSLGSVSAAVLLPVLCLFMFRPFAPYALVMAVLVIFKHRTNIQRIVKGTENKLDFSKYK